MYGCLYLLFEAYPVVFSQGHNLNAGISGLMFLPVSLGGATGVLVVSSSISSYLHYRRSVLVPSLLQPSVQPVH